MGQNEGGGKGMMGGVDGRGEIGEGERGKRGRGEGGGE